MKGNNKIILNAATVMEALQEYFDKRSVKRQFEITAFYAGASTSEYVVIAKSEETKRTSQ